MTAVLWLLIAAAVIAVVIVGVILEEQGGRWNRGAPSGH
jgi:hypothetical protein